MSFLSRRSGFEALAADTQDTLSALRTLATFVENGTIGQLGISNIYDANYLQSLLDAGCNIKTVQNRWYEGNGWDWDGKCASAASARQSAVERLPSAGPERTLSPGSHQSVPVS